MYVPLCLQAPIEPRPQHVVYTVYALYPRRPRPTPCPAHLLGHGVCVPLATFVRSPLGPRLPLPRGYLSIYTIHLSRRLRTFLFSPLVFSLLSQPSHQTISSFLTPISTKQLFTYIHIIFIRHLLSIYSSLLTSQTRSSSTHHHIFAPTYHHLCLYFDCALAPLTQLPLNNPSPFKVTPPTSECLLNSAHP